MAVARYLDHHLPGCRIRGDSALEQAYDTLWNDRIRVQILYRITAAFHVLNQRLGPKLELTHNPARGQHCRKEAVAHAARVNRHLADGRSWLLGGDEPTFADITLCTSIAFSKFPVVATPLDERFEHLDSFRQRWKKRPAFRAAYSDGNSGLEELTQMKA